MLLHEYSSIHGRRYAAALHRQKTSQQSNAAKVLLLLRWRLLRPLVPIKLKPEGAEVSTIANLK